MGERSATHHLAMVGSNVAQVEPGSTLNAT